MSFNIAYFLKYLKIHFDNVEDNLAVVNFTVHIFMVNESGESFG